MSFGFWACPSPSLTALGRFWVFQRAEPKPKSCSTAAVALTSPRGWAGSPQTHRGELSITRGG